MTTYVENQLLNKGIEYQCLSLTHRNFRLTITNKSEAVTFSAGTFQQKNFIGIVRQSGDQKIKDQKISIDNADLSITLPDAFLNSFTEPVITMHFCLETNEVYFESEVYKLKRIIENNQRLELTVGIVNLETEIYNKDVYDQKRFRYL